tara:strand:+ start:837 stop:1763 length:927 start_codon:yes stop_codon:yes gene_type:complete
MNLKKPKFWSAKKPNYIAYLLYPISILITLLSSFRTKSNKRKFKIKTICVGNIFLGGTGKTSLCIKLNEIFKKKNYKSCFIKKYYKSQIDEQKLLENSGRLFLSRKRIDAVRQAENENYDIAILDDGLQDKKIDYDLSLVCFNDLNWIGNGMTIPAGPLRENVNNLKKYNHIFLNGNLGNIENLKTEINKMNSNINVHLGKYVPLNLHEFNKNRKYLVFSGIGNHATFVSMIKINGLEVVKDLEFPDHYTYSRKDIDSILNKADVMKCEIITTEKDFQRIRIFKQNKIKIMKSELKIINEDKLLNLIL